VVAVVVVAAVAVAVEEAIACEQPALPQTDALRRHARVRVRVGSQADAMMRLPASPSIPHARVAAAAEVVEADAPAAPAATGSCSAPVHEEKRQLMAGRELRELRVQRRLLRCD
jgi:hypothetical protein